MKRVLALALCLATASYAQEPAADAPVVVKAGDPAPVDGVLLPDALAVRRGRELAGLRVENEALKKLEPGVPVGVVVLIVVAGVVVGAAGAATVLAVRR